ncbi:hypothetical protein NUW58_g4074 [Xylaria curta]|uniref:Uncharacterized protein n=1 Tax=Xylaria curta TaxID=42375 RepID=A0ACC1P8I0_9PEZI|nr:hypothetical protein NUW58_g4074 [Xylaria curta]
MSGYKVALTTITLLAAAALNGVVAAKPSSGCGNSPKLAGNGTVEHLITVGGKSRKFYLKTPATYDNNHPYRFIFTLHALGGSANQVATGTGGYNAWYGLPPLVNDTTDAIYVAPDGLDRGWANQNDGDVTFLSEVIKQVEADLCIDQSLRFSTGFSYGGAMSYALACSLGSEIRAIAVLSGNPQISGCAGGTSTGRLLRTAWCIRFQFFP